MLSDQNWSIVNTAIAPAAAVAIRADQINPFQEKAYHQSAYSGEGPHDIAQRTFELTIFLWAMGAILTGFLLVVLILTCCLRWRKREGSP